MKPAASPSNKVAVGNKFTRLLVVELIPHSKNPTARCLCDCGKETISQRGALKSGKAKSCGCLRRELFISRLKRLEPQEKKRRQMDRYKQWAKEHPERIREINRKATRKFYRNNPLKAKEGCQNRRARLLKAIGSVSKGIESKLLILQKGKCAYCHFKLRNPMHLDHIVPLAKGGLHEDSNLQLLCARCNLSKGARDPIAFMQSRGKLL